MSRRSGSRNSLLSEAADNKSNSNVAGIKRNTPIQKEMSVKKQNSSSSLKVLGQDGEVTEDTLWNGSVSDRSTPVSSRSQTGGRPGSNMSRRTPTPVKQISLTSVRRKEEQSEPLEPINWSEIDQPFMMENDRVPTLALSDDESDMTLGSRPLSAEDQLALIEQRTKEMTSALSSVCMDDDEADLSRQLEQIETAREERNKRQMEELAKGLGKKDNILTVEDGQFTYRNEHFRDLSHRDPKDKIDKSFIMESRDKTKDDMLKVGKEKKHIMDTTPDTAVAAESIKEEAEIFEKTQVPESESDKKEESTSSDDDSDDDDDDNLIGEKGKAPNALLMEFLTCMMEEDYENAEKLCKMILIYEPENPEALSFLPVIQEKIKQEEEESEDEDDSSDESDDSGEEGGTDDDDDDDDDNDEDDDDDDDDDNSSDSDNEPIPHTDSGIASANSD